MCQLPPQVDDVNTPLGGLDQRLAFEHPLTAQPVEAESPLPEDLETALELARRGPA